MKTKTPLYDKLDAANVRGLSLKQLMLLMILSDEPTPMTYIARHLNTSSAAITGMVDRMDKLGLVKRTHGHHDRRMIMVSITNQGREVCADVVGV